jgi:hypothetical protein
MTDVTPNEEPQPAPDRAEQYRSDVPQNETPVETSNADTGNVEGTRDESLPTENRAADVGAQGDYPREQGSAEPQPEGVVQEGNQAADQGAQGDYPRGQGDTTE